MKYVNTRLSNSPKYTFEEVLFSGYAPGGGLFVPEEIPKISADTFVGWGKFSYPQIVRELLKIYVSPEEIPESDIDEKILKEAYSRFDDDKIVPLTWINDDWAVAELFHGPTWTFKDLALSVVGRLYDYFLEKRQKRTIILVGTSGDTGSAAIEAVKDLKRTDIIVLLPKGRCTEVQELQMTTVHSDNVHVFAVEGSSDDLDIPIKKAFDNVDLVKKANLCSINSINWARILVQIGHYVYSYFRAIEKRGGKFGDEVEFVIPTGAAGNITSGFIAVRMGLPAKLIASVACNDIMDRTLRDGDLSASGEVLKSWATAIDIQMPYNVERLVYVATDFNADLTSKIMREFEDNQKVNLSPELLTSMKKVITGSASYSNEEILKTMKDLFKGPSGYLICPHTAVAVAYQNSYPSEKKCPRVIMATASPAKFGEALKESGIDTTKIIEENPEILSLRNRRPRFEWMRKGHHWDGQLHAKIEQILVKNSETPNEC